MQEKYIEKSGLTVVMNDMPYMTSVSVGIFIKSGSVYENKKNNGIAHFIEHMLFKGTITRSAQMISEEADELGGTLNAYTAEECTCIYIKVLAEELMHALELVFDIAENPVFDKNAIENEKKVIIEEIASSNDNPEDAAQEMLMCNMFPEHPIGMPVLGNEENVNAFNRKILKKYYSEHYVPKNIYVSVAGKIIDVDAVKTFISKRRFALETEVFEKLDDEKNNVDICGGVYTAERDIDQLQLVIGWPSVSRFDDRIYAFTLLAGILGGDGSSRLFRRLREENGLVYNVDCSTLDYEETGVFVVNTSFTSENKNKVIEIIDEETSKIVQDGVTAEELKRAQRTMITTLKLESESTMSMMSIMGKRELYGIERSDDEIIAKYNAVTNDDIIAAARYAFSDKNKKAMAIIGEI